MRRTLLRLREASAGLEAVQHLRHPLRSSGEVFLVGTAHVSSASASQVLEVIRTVRPEHVVVELCEARRVRLEARAGGDAGGGGVLDALLRGFSIPGADFGGQSFAAGLGAMYEVLRAAGLDPGADMLAGIEAGREVGAQVVCGDLPQETTVQGLRTELLATDLPALMRAMDSSSVRDDLAMAGLDIDLLSLLHGDAAALGQVRDAVEQLKDRARIRRLLRVMDAAAPRLMAVLLHARDAHLASRLRSAEVGSGRCVCVVGMAHMDGIVRRYTDVAWKQDPPLPPPPRASAPGLEALRTLAGARPGLGLDPGQLPELLRRLK